MSLIICKECKEQVSSKTKTCPHCGQKMPRNITFLQSFGILVMFLYGVSISTNEKPSANLDLNPSGVMPIFDFTDGYYTPRHLSTEPEVCVFTGDANKPIGAFCLNHYQFPSFFCLTPQDFLKERKIIEKLVLEAGSKCEKWGDADTGNFAHSSKAIQSLVKQVGVISKKRKSLEELVRTEHMPDRDDLIYLVCNLNESERELLAYLDRLLTMCQRWKKGNCSIK